MAQSDKASILVVDDEPEGLRDLVRLGLSDRAKSFVVHPNEVEMSQLKEADLVLVDYKLEKWSERDAQSLSLRPATGLALAVLLREQVDRSSKKGATAFTLHTGHFEKNSGTPAFCDCRARFVRD